MLLRPGARFPLARELHSKQGAELGKVFAFASNLYFRGKLAYAQTFARPPERMPGTLVIIPGVGLVRPEERLNPFVLKALGQIPIDVTDSRYRVPLEESARWLAEKLGTTGEAVLLGSIASRKYTEVLLDALGDRLLFPASFVGRGDMSRGGLLLRCVVDRKELDYIPVEGAVRYGSRPPKLERRAGILAAAKASTSSLK